MNPSDNRIHIDASDLYSPRVNEYVELQQALRRDVGDVAPQPLLIRVVYSSWFYLSLASGLGAFIAWAALEPFFDDVAVRRGEGVVVALLLFPTVAAGIGLFLGAAEGIMCRNLLRSLRSGIVGLGVGFGGGLVALIAGAILFSPVFRISDSLVEEGKLALGILVHMMGRAPYWAIAAIPAGLGQGIATREKKVMLNGSIGGALGGLIGGMLFDPICLLTQESDQATLSRGVGLTIIGLSVGLFVGLVEGWTKTAWLLMRAGPLAGKQFVMFRDTTVLGSSPKAEVYLFKDPAIEPRHAILYNRGGRFEIEDCNTRDGTYVNGVPVNRQLLKSGDQIVLGKTVLEFQLKESHE